MDGVFEQQRWRYTPQHDTCAHVHALLKLKWGGVLHSNGRGLEVALSTNSTSRDRLDRPLSQLTDALLYPDALPPITPPFRVPLVIASTHYSYSSTARTSPYHYQHPPAPALPSDTRVHIKDHRVYRSASPRHEPRRPTERRSSSTLVFHPNSRLPPL